ncbi:MAG: hypothetical protein ABS81_08555 [Pseudonocardia sp. SCN 72-86]|uniref:hypothetical protein n=1 Tax=uncultured Microbacterium sp. TaxID=191216 RepID=UPI00086D916B|nr:hypothetical protein [uncultured Microbacterium sp.]ODU05065.1 MAG: hypothetical protein ABS81_08555 [Pseudonocardia sp. SCN 72-86]
MSPLIPLVAIAVCVIVLVAIVGMRGWPILAIILVATSGVGILVVAIATTVRMFRRRRPARVVVRRSEAPRDR